MSFLKGINKPKDMLLKLIREGNRINFESDPLELVDHFFNFSVTAHSLRDWCIKQQNKINQKKELNQSWDKENYLVIAKDIANSVKHFGITYYLPDVKNSDTETSKTVSFENNIDIAKNLNKALDDQNYRDSMSNSKPSFSIEFVDGNKVSLDDYVFNTIVYWIKYFDLNNISRYEKYDSKLIFVNRKSWGQFT
jgi:hypothetical protein